MAIRSILIRASLTRAPGRATTTLGAAPESLHRHLIHAARASTIARRQWSGSLVRSQPFDRLDAQTGARRRPRGYHTHHHQYTRYQGDQSGIAVNDQALDG